MPELLINIDRERSQDIVIVKCYIDGNKISDEYSMCVTMTDEEIIDYVREDLRRKGYEFE